jgi:DNA-binding CsgD family transcriptional regulator
MSSLGDGTMPTDELDRAIGMVYEAGMGEASWDDAFSALGAPFASGVYAVVWDSLAQRPLFEAVSRDLMQPQPEYHAYYGALDPRRSYTFRLPVGATMACHELFDTDFVRTSEFYNDYLHRWGWRYAMGCRLHGEDGQSVVIGLQRPSGHGPFQRWERDMLAAAQPHLARTFRVRRVLSRTQDQATRRQAMLDRLQAAALLVAADGRVLELNQAAERVLRAGDGLQLRQGRLAARTTAATACLLHLVRDAVAAAARRGTGGGACRLPRADCSFYAVLVTPVAAETLPGPETPAALVLVVDPNRHPLPPEPTLRALYDLTPAEARTAQALLAGQAPREIAGQLGVGLGTVRTHLHRIFDKTGTTSQVDLVRLLLGCVSLLG